MPKFVAKDRDAGEACFVYDEESKLIFELREPADLAHAESVARYLQENVRGLKSGAKITMTVKPI